MPDKPYISNEEYVARLIRVGRWATPGTPIQYAFLEQRPNYLPAEPGWVPFSAGQRAAAYRAFALIAEVTNVTFQQVSDNQQPPGIGNPRINFYANSVNLNFSGSMDPYYLNDSSDIYGADIRLNNARIAQREAQEGFNDFTSFVALHEIMHALGLSHPGDYNGQGFNYQDNAEFVQDTIQYSVMSYWGAAEAGADHFIGSTQYVASTPLLFDILALQSLYGANMATRTGSTVYGFNSNTGQLPFDFAANPGPVIAIWDAGGNDTIDLSGYSTPSLINLNAGEFSDAGGLTRNIAIAFGVMIENAVGGAGNDTLIGNAAANELDGGAGADHMRGGVGDDRYFVRDAGDSVSEEIGGGTDRILASISYILAGEVHVEMLSTSDDAGTAAINLLGNELANIIYGNAGNNILNGARGVDAMVGFGGNDTYYVDQSGDLVSEAVGAGTDRIYASASYGLRPGVHVETLSTTSYAGTEAINLSGNELANALYGNAGSNVLNGGGGIDRLQGFAGNDIYYVDHAHDVVAEAAGGGDDRIFASVSYALRAGVHVETLSTSSNAGTGAINLLGNELANVIYGNTGNNVLNGAGGADKMAGLGGNDSYFVDHAADLISEASGGGSDRVFASVSYALRSAVHVETLSTTNNAGTGAINLLGNELANALYGNNGANVLNGGLGADAILGLGGADTFAFTTALRGGNIDRIGDFLSGTDRIALDDAVFTGLTTGGLASDAFATGSAAQDGNDRIIYNAATGALLFDADGNGAAAAVQFATLSTGLSLSGTDFFVT